MRSDGIATVIMSFLCIALYSKYIWAKCKNVQKIPATAATQAIVFASGIKSGQIIAPSTTIVKKTAVERCNLFQRRNMIISAFIVSDNLLPIVIPTSFAKNGSIFHNEQSITRMLSNYNKLSMIEIKKIPASVTITRNLGGAQFTRRPAHP